MHARSSFAVRSLVPYYSFGRHLSDVSRFGLRLVLALPVVRRLVAGRHALSLPMPLEEFEAILDAIGQVVDRHEWGVFQSTWHSRRLIVFTLDRRGVCTSVTHVAPARSMTFHPRTSGKSLLVPDVLDVRTVGQWGLRIEEPLPPWHDPHPWDIERLRRVTSEIEDILSGQLQPRVSGDDSWSPIHGDLTPWNLRTTETSGTWLLDWEWAKWGPPHADVLRFAVTYCSLSMTDPVEIATWIDTSVDIDPQAMAAAAAFWLEQTMYRDFGDTPPTTSTAVGKERMTGWVEAAALRRLAARL